MKTRLYYLSNKKRMISLRHLKDMMRYKYIVQFSFATSENEVVNICSATSVKSARS